MAHKNLSIVQVGLTAGWQASPLNLVDFKPQLIKCLGFHFHGSTGPL